MKTKLPKAPAPLPPRRRRSGNIEMPPVQTDDVTDDDDASVELPDMDGLEVEEKLGVFNSKFGDKDYKVRVEFFNKDENEFEMVDTVKLDGFDPFSSLKKYGGGRYRLSLLDEGGKYVAKGRMEVRIAKAAADIAAVETSKAPDQSMSLLIQSLQAQNMQNLEIVKAALGRPTPTEKGPSLTELIAAMSGLRNLTPKEEGGLGGIKGTLELMKLMKEIMPESAPEDRSGLMGEVSQAIELFGKVAPMVAARQAQRAPVKPQPQAPPSTTVNYAAGTVVDNPQPTPEPESPMKPVLDKAQSYIPQLVSWAQRGKDIESVAEFILDEVDNEIVPLIVKHYRPGGITLNNDLVFEQLLTKAQAPEQVAALFEIVPALAPYREWFERVVAKAVEFANEPAVDDESNPADGNHD